MFEHFKADLAHFLALPDAGASPLRRIRNLVMTQGVWAVAVYRFGRWVHTAAPRGAGVPLRIPYVLAAKVIEVTTGIRIPPRASIGAGLYIGHFGGIIVHPDAVLGEGCSISPGVTIGTRGGGRAKAPRIGDRVYIGTGAKVLGNITVGNDARIGANAVVLEDVPSGGTAVGVPARVRVRDGSNVTGVQADAR